MLCLQVITTPFGTSFDQLRTADEVQYKFDRCCKALQVSMALHRHTSCATGAAKCSEMLELLHIRL
jgi:hypothetical protein